MLSAGGGHVRGHSNTQRLQRDLLFHLTNVRQSLEHSAGSYNGIGGVAAQARDASSAASSAWRLVWMELYETERIFVQDVVELELLCEKMVTAYGARPVLAKTGSSGTIPSLLRRVTIRRSKHSADKQAQMPREKLKAWRSLFTQLEEIRLAHEHLYDATLRAPEHPADSESEAFTRMVSSLHGALPNLFPLHRSYSRALVRNVHTLRSLLVDDEEFAACWANVLQEHGLSSSWSLEWALAKPLHRLIKYPLIFTKWLRCATSAGDKDAELAVTQLLDMTHSAIKQIDTEKGLDESIERLRLFGQQMSFKNAVETDQRGRRCKQPFVYQPYTEDGSRRLVLEGEFRHIVRQQKTFTVSACPIQLFLLTDQLLIGQRVTEQSPQNAAKNKGVAVLWEMLHPPIPLVKVEMQSLPDLDGVSSVIQLKIGKYVMYNISASGAEVKERWLRSVDTLKNGGSVDVDDDVTQSLSHAVEVSRPMMQEEEAEPLYKSPCRLYCWKALDSTASEATPGWVPLGHCRLDIHANGLLTLHAIPITGRSLYWMRVTPSLAVTYKPDPSAEVVVSTGAKQQWFQITMYLFSGNVGAGTESKPTLVSLKIKEREKVLELQHCLASLLAKHGADDQHAPDEDEGDANSFRSMEQTDAHGKYVVEPPLFASAATGTFEMAPQTSVRIQSATDGSNKTVDDGRATPATISLRDINVSMADSSVHSSEAQTAREYQQMRDEADDDEDDDETFLMERRPILHERHSSLQDVLLKRSSQSLTSQDRQELTCWLDKLVEAVVHTAAVVPAKDSNGGGSKQQPSNSLMDTRLERAQLQLVRLRQWIDTVCDGPRADQAATGMRILRKLEHELAAIQRFGLATGV